LNFSLHFCASEEKYEESGTWVLFPAWQIGSHMDSFPNKRTVKKLLMVLLTDICSDFVMHPGLKTK
jgi:hypothetical protein